MKMSTVYRAIVFVASLNISVEAQNTAARVPTQTKPKTLDIAGVEIQLGARLEDVTRLMNTLYDVRNIKNLDDEEAGWIVNERGDVSRFYGIFYTRSNVVTRISRTLSVDDVTEASRYYKTWRGEMVSRSGSRCEAVVPVFTYSTEYNTDVLVSFNQRCGQFVLEYVVPWGWSSQTKDIYTKLTLSLANPK